MDESAETRPFGVHRLHTDVTAESNVGNDLRSHFEHDRDRILYSSAFRRLAGVTQVAAVREFHLLHNRLTHSLKVAQLGRRIAQRLANGKDFSADLGCDSRYLPDIVESAGLAHDIGHPPFGHIAEGVLRSKLREFFPSEDFEGNAQSFRVVTKLAVAREEYPGLNLCRATLNAVLKYPQFAEEAFDRSEISWANRSYGQKWGAYYSEEREFRWARGREGDAPDRRGRECKRVRSPAAVIMDWADDVSYATHDLNDYFRSGLIPLHTLRNESEAARGDFLGFATERLKSQYLNFDDNCALDFKNAYSQLLPDLPERKWRDCRDDRVRLARMTNELIARFANAVGVGGDSGVEVPSSVQYQVEALKQLTWFYVINRPSLALAQEGQKAIVAQLFDMLMDLLRRGGKKGQVAAPVPAFLADLYDEAKRATGLDSQDGVAARTVADYICVLTEDQALDLYERITGISVSRASIFGAWFD